MQFMWEVRKALIMHRALFAMIAAIVLTVATGLVQKEYEHAYSPEVYRRYTAELAGEYTEQKHARLQGRYEEIQTLLSEHAELEQQYYDGQLELVQWKEHNRAFSLAQAEQSTVEYLLQKCDYYTAVGTEGKEFFYDTDWQDFLEHLGFPVVTFVLVLFMAVPVFDGEYNLQSLGILRTTKNGRGPVYRGKMFYALLVVPFVVWLLRVLQYVMFCVKSGTEYAEKSLGNLIGYHVYGEMSLQGFFFTEILLEALAWMSIVAFICLLCQWCRNTVHAYFLAFAVVILELIIAEAVSATWLPYLLSGTILSGNHSPELSIPGYAISCAVKVAIFVWLGYRKWAE